MRRKLWNDRYVKKPIKGRLFYIETESFIREQRSFSYQRMDSIRDLFIKCLFHVLVVENCLWECLKLKRLIVLVLSDTHFDYNNDY